MKKIIHLLTLVCLILILFFSSDNLIQADDIPSNYRGSYLQSQANLPEGMSGTVTSIEEKPSNDKPLTEDQINCKKAEGCWNNICYPAGHVRNETYCGFTGKTSTYSYGTFLNQSKAGAQCNHSYECKSGF